jgi:hypothetical protein
VTVVDLYPALLRLAAGRVARLGWDKVATVLGDATTYEPPDGPVDAVTFSYSPAMIPDWFRAEECGAAGLLRKSQDAPDGKPHLLAEWRRGENEPISWREVPLKRQSRVGGADGGPGGVPPGSVGGHAQGRLPSPVRVGVNQALFDLDLVARQPQVGKDGVPQVRAQFFALVESGTNHAILVDLPAGRMRERE